MRPSRISYYCAYKTTRERCRSFPAGRKGSRGREGPSVTVPAGGRLPLPPLPRALHAMAISVPRMLSAFSPRDFTWTLPSAPTLLRKTCPHVAPARRAWSPENIPRRLPSILGAVSQPPQPPPEVSAQPQGASPTLPPCPASLSTGGHTTSRLHRCGRTLCPCTWHATWSRQLPPTCQDRAKQGGKSRAWSLPSEL